MKGIAWTLGGILVILFLFTLVLLRLNAGVNVERSIVTVEGKIVSFENYVEILMRTVNQSVEFNAQRAAYEMGKVGGGNVLWTDTPPTINSLEKTLEDKIISILPKGKDYSGSKEILWGSGEISVEKYNDPATCGPIQNSNCFFVKGNKYLTAYDDSIDSRISLNQKINSNISSNYFKLLEAGRRIVSDANYKNVWPDVGRIQNLLNADFGPAMRINLAYDGNYVQVSLWEDCLSNNEYYCIAPTKPGETTIVHPISLEVIQYDYVKLVFKILSNLKVQKSIVGQSDSSQATAFSWQRKTFYDSQNVWSFFYKNSGIKYKTSLDKASTWGLENTVNTGVDTKEYFSVWHSQPNEITVAWTDYGASVFPHWGHYYFIKGSTSSVWDATKVVSDKTVGPEGISISKDTNNKYWVGNFFCDSSDLVPCPIPNVGEAVKLFNSADGITFIGSYKSPYSDGQTGHSKNPSVIIPLNNGKLMIIYNSYDRSFLRYSFYDGSTWGSETNVAPKKNDYNLDDFSAVADSNGKVHLVYEDVNGDLQYRSYDGSWSSDIALDSGSIDYPVISADQNDNLYAFWVKNNVIYFKTYKYGGTWSSTSQAIFGIVFDNPKYLSSMYYGNGIVGVEWTEGTVAPYNVTYGALLFPESPECNDKADNDLDGLRDKQDPGCHTDLDATNGASYDPTLNDESRETDMEPPKYYFDRDDSGGSVVDGTLVNISTLWKDNTKLEFTEVSHLDCGGGWSIKPDFPATKDAWNNHTIDTAGCGGKTICWYEIAGDPQANRNETMMSNQHCFNVQAKSQCADGIDNDNDGKCDLGSCGGGLPTDPDCTNKNDNTECGEEGTSCLISTNCCSGLICYSSKCELPDTEPPKYSYDSVYLYSPAGDMYLKMSVLWSDNRKLNFADIGFNDTGGWSTTSYFFSGNPEWFNYTLKVTSLIGKTLCWYQRAVDSQLNENNDMYDKVIMGNPDHCILIDYKGNMNISVAEDSFVSQSMADTVMGTSSMSKDVLGIYAPAGMTMRTWLKFSLSAIPVESKITYAKLWMYSDFIDFKSEIKDDVDVHLSSTDSWSESALTWNNALTYGPITSSKWLSNEGWYSWDVTSAVQSELTGNRILSLVLTVSPPDSARYWFESKEKAYNNEAYIELEYTI